MAQNTYRAFNGLRRTHTAISLIDNTIQQVFPFQQIFPNLETWKLACVDATHFEADVLKTGAARREAEFGELLSMEYAWIVRNVKRINENTISLTLNDTSICTITRSLDFQTPPNICRNGITYIDGYNVYRPDMSCAYLLTSYLFA